MAKAQAELEEAAASVGGGGSDDAKEVAQEVDGTFSQARVDELVAAARESERAQLREGSEQATAAQTELGAATAAAAAAEEAASAARKQARVLVCSVPAAVV